MLQKLKKYALPLLLLQFILIIAVGFYLQNQLDKAVQQKEDIQKVFKNYQYSQNKFTEEEVEYILNIMQVEELKMRIQKGKFYHTFHLWEYADSLINKIEKVASVKEESLDIFKLLTDCRTHVLEKLNKISADMEKKHVHKIFDYVEDWNDWEAAQFLENSQTENARRKYFEGVKNSFVFLQNELVRSIFYHTKDEPPSRFAYFAHLVADDHVPEGETLKIKLTLAKRLLNPPPVIVGSDTIAADEDGFAAFQKPVSRIGEYELKGRYTNKYLLEKAVSKTYSVSSKCSQ